MVYMAQIEKVLSDSEASSSSVDDKISEVSYYLSESESESEYETSEYYNYTTTYGLFVNDNDDHEIFHDCENFPENLIESQIDHNESAIDHNDSEGINKLIRKFNKKIALCLKRIEKANQQNKDFENQNKDLQDKYDVLKNQATTFKMNNKELNEQLKVLIEKNDDLLAQTKVLKDQLQVKHVVIDTHVEYLDTFSSVRRPKHSGVIKKKKGSSNTSNVDLSSVSHLKLNKYVKRYSRKDLLSCNNSHLEETSSVYDCNDAMNVSCNSRLYDSFDENNLFIFDDENVRIYPVSKMYFRKKPHDFLNGLEVAFRKSACFVRNEEGVDLLTGDRSSNLYTISLNEVASNSSTCLLAKASSSQSWLWHQHLSHLNFTTINNLVKNNLVQGLPNMKFKKDHLCSACEQGKIHRKHHKSKTDFASNKPLYLLHMDLCGPMRVESINEKRYVLVVGDDYSQYTWVFFLHSKDEASEVIISIIKKTQVNLQIQVQRVRTDNGTEFKNKTLTKFFDKVGITQQFSVARTPQQNGVVKRRNRTLVEAARTMLTFANLPLFLWAEAIVTACFIQNRLIIHKRFDKTPYELMNKRNPNIKFFCVFGCRCYLLNDYKDVGKLTTKGDIGVFFGYSKESATFRIYNKRTRKIHKSVNVNFDEISKMASNQLSLEPGLSNLNKIGKSSNQSVLQVSEASKKDLEDLFQNFYDKYFDSSKIMKSSTMNVETSNVEIPSQEEEVFYEDS
nr:retrovirus-related Pol polyprotein from transposon TNT 1-94 [Tanacetum cinerariifolium]